MKEESDYCDRSLESLEAQEMGRQMAETVREAIDEIVIRPMITEFARHVVSQIMPESTAAHVSSRDSLTLDDLLRMARAVETRPILPVAIAMHPKTIDIIRKGHAKDAQKDNSITIIDSFDTMSGMKLIEDIRLDPRVWKYFYDHEAAAKWIKDIEAKKPL